MNADGLKWKDEFASAAIIAGACAWGICDASPVDSDVVRSMREWIEKGYHGEMHYLMRHMELKESVESVLPGCRSIVSLAFPYRHELKREADSLVFSRYATGRDYHIVLRELVKPLCSLITDAYGGSVRVCVDSAPLAERYYAVKCGLGTLGRNGMLYVEGYGSWVFLCEILSTALLPTVSWNDNMDSVSMCGSCRRCIDVCPGGAILGNGTIDSRRCRSYLTIENRDECLPAEIRLGKRVYGCDICQEVCPINSDSRQGIAAFVPRDIFRNITKEQLSAIDDETFSTMATESAISRISIRQLKRNADRCE